MAQPDLYQIPKTSKDNLRHVFSSIGACFFLMFLSCWAATQYVAWRFGFNPALGEPMLPWVYFPFEIAIWQVKFNRLQASPAVMEVLRHGWLILGTGNAAASTVAIALYRRRRGKSDNERNDLHGSAHWADAEEVESMGILPSDANAGGVLFGAWQTARGVWKYLCHIGAEHLLLFAPSRSGKGVGAVIPTLLNWFESVIVHDVKRENWEITSGFRHRVLGQRVIKFDPASPDSARFNPLQEVRLNQHLVKDVQNVATMIVDPNGKGLEDHWSKTGFDLLTGVLLFVLLCDVPESIGKIDRCIATVLAILSDGGPFRELAMAAAPQPTDKQAGQNDDHDDDANVVQRASAVLTYIRDTAHGVLLQHQPNDATEDQKARAAGWRVVAESTQSWLNKPRNEAGSVLSTALSFLSLYRDPVVAENTRVSDFTLQSLMGGMDVDGKPCKTRTSLYLVVPPSDMDRLRPLTRLILTQFTRRMTEGLKFDQQTASAKSIYPYRMLMLIDEFPALGRLEVLQQSLAFLAGYGIKVFLIAQDLSQLHAAYGKDESITSNCHIRIAYAPNRIETAELLSRMAGQATVQHTQRQYSGHRMSVMLGHVNTNEQIVQRPLLTADECMRLPPDAELVFMAGHAPIYCNKIRYYLDDALLQRARMGPAAVTGRRA